MDADAVHQEVKRRIVRAEDLKIKETVWSLYQNSFRLYPAWAKNCAEYIFPSVTEPAIVAPGKVQLTINGAKYLFSYNERDDPVPDHTENRIGSLSLYLDDRLVLEFEINITLPYEWYDKRKYELWGIGAFVEGPWVIELQALLPQVKNHEQTVREERRKRDREDPKKLADLKSRFGL